MAVLFGSHPAYAGHEAGRGHPETPARLRAVERGIALAGVGEALESFAPRPATIAEITAVHDRAYLAALEDLCAAGGGALDPDTAVAPASYEAALRAAGAGPDAIERLGRGEGDAAFLAVRPPGHHARASSAMGFCLLNNVAIATAELVRRGERVVVLDWDAHHGNGTQERFYAEPEVLYVSLHQFPAYPGTGAVDETGVGPGRGTTLNLPFPAGTAGDAYRRALDEVVVPAVEEFSPSWLVVSAGFDAHRADPITDLGLSAADFADLTERVMAFALPGRRLFFLEGGYDAEGLALSAGACIARLCGEAFRPERATARSPEDVHGEIAGRAAEVLERARRLHAAALAG